MHVIVGLCQFPLLDPEQVESKNQLIWAFAYPVPGT